MAIGAEASPAFASLGFIERAGTMFLTGAISFSLIDELGYNGWVGCEYKPLQSTLGGLRWANDYGIGIPSPILSTSQSAS